MIGFSKNINKVAKLSLVKEEIFFFVAIAINDLIKDVMLETT